jgi:hypothetical protein
VLRRRCCGRNNKNSIPRPITHRRGRRRHVRECHRTRYAAAASRTRDRARLGERQSVGGQCKLVAVAEAPHAPEARHAAVAVAVAIEQAGRGEGLRRAGPKPFGGGPGFRRRYTFALIANVEATGCSCAGYSRGVRER